MKPFSPPSAYFRRTILSLLIILSIQFGWTEESESPGRETPLKILTIGNSFADNLTRYFPQLLDAANQPHVLYRANLGGATFKRHADHLRQWRENPEDPGWKVYKQAHVKTQAAGPFSLAEVLKMDDWNFVTVQQVSYLSYRPNSYEPYASELLEAIREFAPTAEILVHQVWAYRDDHRFFAKDDFNPEEMHQRMRSTYRDFAARNGLRVIPVGDAFHLARQTERWSYQPDPDYPYDKPIEGKLPDERSGLHAGYRWSNRKEQPEFRLDGIHANKYGCYLGACVLYRTLFPDQELPTFVPGPLSEKEAADLRGIAEKTFRDFQQPSKNL
jgi:hypothetical protein